MRQPDVDILDPQFRSQVFKHCFCSDSWDEWCSHVHHTLVKRQDWLWVLCYFLPYICHPPSLGSQLECRSKTIPWEVPMNALNLFSKKQIIHEVWFLIYYLLIITSQLIKHRPPCAMTLQLQSAGIRPGILPCIF